MAKNYWYAILLNDDDTDWDTGSYDLNEAIDLLLSCLVTYPNAYMAVIDNSFDPICVDIVRVDRR